MSAAPPSGGMTVQDRRAMNFIDRDNPVFSEPIQSPAAWTGSEIGGKAGVSRRLTPAQIETLWDLVERTRDRALTDATPADFADPLIDRLMDDVRHELIHGKGVVLLSDLDCAAFNTKPTTAWPVSVISGISSCLPTPTITKCWASRLTKERRQAAKPASSQVWQSTTSVCRNGPRS
jgi:hypothetical protein